MAVLVEANSAIVRIQAVHDRYAGGWPAFADSVPNNTLCSDSEVARVGFMDPNDCQAFIGDLERHGLAFLREGRCQDVAVAIQTTGLTIPYDWLEFGYVEEHPGKELRPCG